jgi:cytochrome c oxidase cbb3-type subunit 3
VSSESATSISEDFLSEHSYDGIQEYDNPLPGWWKFLFWTTIVFSPIYYFYFHFGVEGRSIYDQYNSHMAAVFEQRFAELGELEADRATILKYMNDDPKWLAVGQAVYATHCTSCHKADGSGEVGPNLTDEYWKNVRNVEDIASVIENGAANGAMPAWKNRLSHKNQVVLTAAYIAKLREKPLPGKPPEGNFVGPWTK